MAATIGILPADLGSSTSRIPLRPKAVTPTPTNTIRRKGSFIRLADSSEELPSSHESIFEAFCFSASEASSHHAELVDIPSRIPRPVKKNDENSRDVSPSNFIDTIHFRYGNGTVLDTITEQKSYTTISSKARTKSADNSPSIPFLGHRDSFIISKTPRRQISFSLDDIEEIKRSYHDACVVIEQELCKPLLVQEIYAEPKVPIQAPPDRPPTPEGMPSWTEAQVLAIPRRRQSNLPQASHQSRVRRFFNLSSAPTLSSCQVSDERNRTVSAPVPGRTAPRFRPPKSVYGAIDQHPFAKAPIVKTQSVAPSAIPRPKGKRLQKQQRVRFTPSATARDSEANMLQAAIESTTATAPHPFQPFPTTETPPPKKVCPHRKTSGSIAAQDNPRTTTATEYSTIHSPVPYHRDEDTTLPSPNPGTALPDSPLPQTQAELDSLCVLESPQERPASVSSTTYLMTGALRAPTPPPPSVALEPELAKENWCWRCTLRSAVGKLDDWWMKSARCICFVCCGFDIEDDMDGERERGDGRGNGSGSGTGSGRGSGYRSRYSEMEGPRRVVLGKTLAGSL
ncbi:hypothetical protein ONS96_003768 [Cadophora gregata f. sp. sojae]|nr:hypothetical protein ONS96_003768 [Cadophora gregata f. sp. sojae]